MFTLKLYHHTGGSTVRRAINIISVNYVEVLTIGEHTIELRAFKSPYPSSDYDTFYIGERTKEMTAIDDDNHWDWGLLENAAGKTTEHFRPHTYG